MLGLTDLAIHEAPESPTNMPDASASLETQIIGS